MEGAKGIGEALARIHAVVKGRKGIHVVHTSEMSRKDREALLRGGWLQEIIKGWYLFVRPDVRKGDSSSWYASFWDFLFVYLSHHYGEDYCLSAEHSLDLHVGVSVVPRQVVVMASKGRGAPIDLPFDTSVLIYSSSEQLPKEREIVKGLQVMSLPYALCKVSPTFFKNQPCEAEIALKAISNSADLLKIIVSNNFVRAAGRLVGAYRFLGNLKMVDDLLNGFAGFNIRIQENNPFIHAQPLLTSDGFHSPHAFRIIALWQQYRRDVIEHFPKPPGRPSAIQEYLQKVDEQYVQDAYNSLSIEGYQVSLDLIEKVRQNKWIPESHDEDRRQLDALAARGYFEAFLEVKTSLGRVLDGASPGDVVQSDLSRWYRKLFAPCVAVNIIEASDLVGYRSHQVYIRNSRHTPFPAQALNESMVAFFQCLRDESHPGVRAVLGHFLFVFIHPYMDGNGRIGRFLMNVMLGAGGYPWTIVHMEHRRQYLDALEEASCADNIIPFVQFLSSELMESGK